MAAKGKVEEKSSHELPWTEKYRPTQFDELISHQEITKTLTRLIEKNQLPHLLFYGPPGTGKTTTILTCARKMYGASYQSMILELNASDDRGIGVVREKVKDFASTMTVFSAGMKLIILDEADQMTAAAQAALRRIMEKYTKHVRFCLICNYVGKIIPAIQSRCTRFRFSPVEDDQARMRLNVIAKQEKLNITPGGMDAVISLSKGDMRKSLNILQAVSMAFNEITSDAVYSTTGNPTPSDIEKVVTWLLNEHFEIAYQNTRKVQILKGVSTRDIITELHDYILRIDLPADVRVLLLDRLSTIEYRICSGSSEELQLGSLVGLFQEARHKTATLEGKT